MLPDRAGAPAPLSPGRPTTWAWRGSAWGRLTRPSPSSARPSGSSPTSRWRHNNLGNALRLRGDKAQAQSTISAGPCELDPNLVEAHTNLGQLLLEHYRAAGGPRPLPRGRPAPAGLPRSERNNLGNVLPRAGPAGRGQGLLCRGPAAQPETWPSPQQHGPGAPGGGPA